MFAHCFAMVVMLPWRAATSSPQALWPLGASSALVRQQHLPACEILAEVAAKSFIAGSGPPGP